MRERSVRTRVLTGGVLLMGNVGVKRGGVELLVNIKKRTSAHKSVGITDSATLETNLGRWGAGASLGLGERNVRRGRGVTSK